jgi:hypothetical protein
VVEQTENSSYGVRLPSSDKYVSATPHIREYSLEVIYEMVFKSKAR